MKGIITCSIVLYKSDITILNEAITSFLATDLNINLFLIDNSPTDNLRSVALDARILYLHNPANPGFGASHNLAIKKAIELGSDYHLVLNPDVYYNPGNLEILVKFMDENLDVGNVMPKVLYPDGKIQYLCKLLPTPYDWIGRRFNPFKNVVERRNKLFELKFTDYNNIMEVPYLSGCFMFLRTSALQKAGLFDENIFMYGEEADLCRRLIHAGFKTVFNPYAIIYHHFEKGSHKSLKLTWIGIKSAIYYFNKWGWLIDRQRREINETTLRRVRSEVIQ